MKYLYLSIAVCVAVILLTDCKSQKDTILLDCKGKGVSKEDVYKIAQKYDLQDSVFSLNMTNLLREEVLQCLSMEEIDTFFKDWRDVINAREMEKERLSRVIAIKSIDDFLIFTDNWPNEADFYVRHLEKDKGGNYYTFKEKVMSGTYKICISSSGVITVLKDGMNCEECNCGRELIK
jgi:hypothetical protein